MIENRQLRASTCGTPRAIEQVMTNKISKTKFLAEVTKLGGTTDGALDWLDEAIRCGLEDADDEASLAWDCVDDEIACLDPDSAVAAERARVLRARLASARSGGGTAV